MLLLLVSTLGGLSLLMVLLGLGRSGELLVQQAVLIVRSDLMKEGVDVRVGLSGVGADLGLGLES